VEKCTVDGVAYAFVPIDLSGEWTNPCRGCAGHFNVSDPQGADVTLCGKLGPCTRGQREDGLEGVWKAV
jgi:hypothetical protein